jgi:hypothetical protein
LDAFAYDGDVVLARQLDRPVLEPYRVRRRRSHPASVPYVEAEMVVVATGRDERRRSQVRLQLKPERVVVKTEALADIADVQVEVPKAQALADLWLRGFLGDARKQVVEVKRRHPVGVHVGGPPLAGTVSGKLNPVAIDVREIDGLVGAVVREALERRSRRGDAHNGARELLAAWIEKRVVVEARVAPGALGGRVFVQNDDRLPSVTEFRLAWFPPMQPQPQSALVPRDRAIQIADREVDRPQSQGRGQGGREMGMGVRRRGHIVENSIIEEIAAK